MSKLVFIYSIPRNTATGISDWVSDTSGIKLKKTKVGKAKDRLPALYDDKVGGLANYISYNYYKDPVTGETVKNEKGEPMLLQEYLEKKWNQPAGYFSNQQIPKSYRGNGSDLGYYYQEVWPLNDGCTVLDLDKMHDEIGYYVMLASSRVANSEREWRDHKWPRATHYIALENESEELKYKRTQMKSKAFALLHSSDFTEVIKRKIITLMELAPARTKLTEQQVHNILSEQIENSGYATGSSIEKINNLAQLLKTADGREKFEAMHLLREAEDFRVVVSKQDIWTFLNPKGSPITMGNRYTEAIDFIMNPKKSEEVNEIRAQIKEKQKDL